MAASAAAEAARALRLPVAYPASFKKHHTPHGTAAQVRSVNGRHPRRERVRGSGARSAQAPVHPVACLLLSFLEYVLGLSLSNFILFRRILAGSLALGVRNSVTEADPKKAQLFGQPVLRRQMPKSVKDLGNVLPQSEAVRMVLDTFVLNVPDVSGISLTAENVVSAADDGKASWQVGDAIVWVDGTEVRKGKAAVADSMKPDVATHTMVVQRMVPAKPGFVTFIARIAGDPGLGIGLTEDNRISELGEKRPGRNDGRLEVHCAARSRRSSSGRSQLPPSCGPSCCCDR